jgi:xanthine dehydrogenase accessory factor
MDAIYGALAEIQEDNSPAALCTVVRSEGSTPRHVGSKMLVYADGHFIGTVGGGEMESRIIKAALASIQNGETQMLSYAMADPARGDPGVCGGQVEVFVEPILPAPTVVVIGAGHVGRAVAHLAKWLGFRVAVSDDRPEFGNKAAVPEADAFHVGPMNELPQKMNIDNRTFLILTTRGSPIDAAGLNPLLESAAAYIGVIGSKRRWATTVKELQARGVPEERIARVHSPMGLELQAETPEEIAVSIMAEILMIRDKGSGKTMKG